MNQLPTFEFCDKTDIVVVEMVNFVKQFHEEALDLANSYKQYNLMDALTATGKIYGGIAFMRDSGPYYCLRFNSEKEKLSFLLKYA
jgi:hypothetical protein